jgi:hypothetical protein
MDRDRVDLVIQYALAVAGQNDFGERELGPIHLLKYVYLGDLAYAARNEGATFTGTPWRFYKFGPWAAEVHERIRPAVERLGAVERTFSSPKYEGEATRWRLAEDMDEVVLDLEDKLPATLASAVRRAVRDHGADTTSLLHYVYLTPPMLHAAPNEDLSFALAVAAPGAATSETDEVKALTEKQKKKRREAMLKLRKELRDRPRMKLVAPQPPPVYDDVFEAGLRALDADGGDEIASEAGDVEFSDAIWKARGRHEPGPP